MTWLLIALLAYLFLAIVSLFDRYFLVGPIPHPKVYTFYIGILWILISLIFFVFGATIPSQNIVLLGLAAGFIRIFAILFLNKAIGQSEVSRAVPAMNGLLPIFSFFIFFLYFPSSEILNIFQIIAFILLVFGSVLISSKKLSLSFFSFENLKYPAISAFLFALSFLLTKNLFLKVDFLDALPPIWIGGGLGAMTFLISRQFRKTLFSQKIAPKVSGFLLLGQLCGAVGVLLQFYSIFLARPGQVPLINALEGTRDVFILLFVFILYLWRPNLLKEKMTGAVGFQKTLAIILIGAGLAILAFK